VVPLGTKGLFAMAVLGAIAAFVYGVVADDAAGTTLLVAVAAAAAVAGVVVLFADPDRAPWYAPDTPIALQSPSGGRPSLPSPWPLGAAVALGVLALGAATDAVVIGGAAVLLAFVAVAWLFQQFSEHPTYTARYGARLKERLVLPIGLPLTVIILVAIIAGSLSRVFLALPENGTRAVALVIALVILLTASAIAASDRIARNALAALTAFAFACVVAAGIVGLVHGERTFEKPKPIPHAPLPPGINPTITGGSSGAAVTSPSTLAP
jgi:hypothetical protein